MFKQESKINPKCLVYCHVMKTKRMSYCITTCFGINIGNNVTDVKLDAGTEQNNGRKRTLYFLDYLALWLIKQSG